MRRSAFDTNGERKAVIIGESDDFRPFAAFGGLKVWKQNTEFSGDSDWIFASPLKHGRLPYYYTGFWRELDRADRESGIGHIGTHTFRHSYRMWIDAVGTPIGILRTSARP